MRAFGVVSDVVLSLRERLVFYPDACEEIMKNMKRRAVGRCFWALVCSSAHQTLTANRPLFTNTLSFSRLLCWQNALLRGTGALYLAAALLFTPARFERPRVSATPSVTADEDRHFRLKPENEALFIARRTFKERPVTAKREIFSQSGSR